MSAPDPPVSSTGIPARAIAVVADDLIWGERLASLARQAGAATVRVRDRDGLRRALEAPGPQPLGAIVDLTARAFVPVDAIAELSRGGLPVLAVGQHDDRETRQRATAAGADRVLAYGRVHAAGAATVGAWVADLIAAGAARHDHPEATR